MFNFSKCLLLALHSTDELGLVFDSSKYFIFDANTKDYYPWHRCLSWRSVGGRSTTARQRLHGWTTGDQLSQPDAAAAWCWFSSSVGRTSPGCVGLVETEEQSVVGCSRRLFHAAGRLLIGRPVVRDATPPGSSGTRTPWPACPKKEHCSARQAAAKCHEW